MAQWRLKPRAFRWPYKYSTTELPRHPVISPTTFPLKPTLVTIIQNLQCFLWIREMFWNSDSITGIFKSNPFYIIQISGLIYLNSWKFNLSRIVKKSSLNLLDRTFTNTEMVIIIKHGFLTKNQPQPSRIILAHLVFIIADFSRFHFKDVTVYAKTIFIPQDNLTDNF